MSSFGDLPERVAAVEKKVDALSASLETRFDAVDVAIAEQRSFTMFVYEQLDARMQAGFAQIDGRFAQIDERFGQMNARFDRIEGKLDGFIDTQSRFNQIAERRLERLEQRDPPKRVKGR
jgi:hypothetical protein